MKKIVSITIARFFSFFLVSVLLLTCNKDEVDDPQKRQVIMTKSISSAGGRLALSNYNGDSVIITIPAGALVDDVNITMRILDKPPVSSVSKIVFPGLVLEPSGLIFKKPANLEIKFSNSLVDELLIFTLNQRDQIRIIETNKISNSLVRGEILHFSPYFVGIPTLDELITLLFEIVVYGGDMNALGILETLGDVYSLVGYGNILNALDQSDKSNEAVDAAKSMLTEKAFEILGSIPSNPCGDYQTSLGYFTQVMAKILPGSDALKMINLQAINIEKECESEGPFDICKYVSEISVSKDALQLDKNGTHQLSILSYNSDGELLEGYDIEEAWSSSDENKVVVNNGLVTGVEVGEAIITAQVCDLIIQIKVEVTNTYELTWKFNANWVLEEPVPGCDYEMSGDGVWEGSAVIEEHAQGSDKSYEITSISSDGLIQGNSNNACHGWIMYTNSFLSDMEELEAQILESFELDTIDGVKYMIDPFKKSGSAYPLNLLGLHEGSFSFYNIVDEDSYSAGSYSFEDAWGSLISPTTIYYTSEGYPFLIPQNDVTVFSNDDNDIPSDDPEGNSYSKSLQHIYAGVFDFIPGYHLNEPSGVVMPVYCDVEIKLVRISKQ